MSNLDKIAVSFDTIFRRVEFSIDVVPILHSMIDSADSLSSPADFASIRSRVASSLTELVLAQVIDQLVESNKFQALCKATSPSAYTPLDSVLSCRPPCPEILTRLYDEGVA